MRTLIQVAGAVIVALTIAACGGATSQGAGWTTGPTGELGRIEPTPVVAPSSAGPAPVPSPSVDTPVASPLASPPASSAAPPIATLDGRPPLRYPEVESYGVLTIAFAQPALQPISLHLECEWLSPSEVGGTYLIGAAVTLAGESVTFYFEPRSPGYGFRIERRDAASYSPSRASGTVGLESVGPGWASGVLRFDLTVDPLAEPGPLAMPIEHWTRPIGDDPQMRWLRGTATWACEPAPPTVPEPGPIEPIDPGPTVPPLPQLTLAAGDVRRTAVSGCGMSFTFDGYSAADSCGPSYQALGVDYIVRVARGRNLRFVIPEGWRFERWAVGWASQIEAERWHGEEPDTFEVRRTGSATSGRVLEVTAPPVGDWSVRLDWTGTRGDDSFSSPDYFRVLVE